MTVVVKIGGACAVDPARALADVATLRSEGEDVVVVHGGSTAVDDTLHRLGIEPEYVETPSGVVGRFTDSDTMEVFEMVLGHLNTQIVADLQSHGVDAVGITGVDGMLLAGPRKSAVRVVEDGTRKIRRGDHSGIIEQVDDELLVTLLSNDYTPVVSPPMAGMNSEASGETDTDGEWIPVNTDADRAAAAVAGALDAPLAILTDVEGIYADADDADTLIESVATAREWDGLTSAAEGFMRRKVMAAKEALEGGAGKVIVSDATVETPLLAALDGAGTHIRSSAVSEGVGMEP